MLRSVRSKKALTEATADARVTAEVADAAGAPMPRGGRARLAVIAVVGLAILLVGGQLFVSAATTLARSWGMSERVVGLTIVAIGTSLPELVTSVIAALRGHSDIAVGNVIGSNVFNVLLCLGIAGLVGPIVAAPGSISVDLGACVGMTLVAAVFARTARTMRRWEGAVLGGLYAAFLGYLIVSGAG
jgi:cation:H+ antiporter